MSGPRYAPHPNAAWRALKDVVVAITPDNRQHELAGDVEMLVWKQLADGGRSLDELTQLIVLRFEVDAAEARDDLEHFMAQLNSAELITTL